MTTMQAALQEIRQKAFASIENEGSPALSDAEAYDLARAALLKPVGNKNEGWALERILLLAADSLFFDEEFPESDVLRIAEEALLP